jgi:hypothetical protein
MHDTPTRIFFRTDEPKALALDTGKRSAAVGRSIVRATTRVVHGESTRVQRADAYTHTSQMMFAYVAMDASRCDILVAMREASWILNPFARTRESQLRVTLRFFPDHAAVTHAAECVAVGGNLPVNVGVG